ncbi:MAG: DNA replication complex subunit Gins51 [Thermoproteota archaeon]
MNSNGDYLKRILEYLKKSDEEIHQASDLSSLIELLMLIRGEMLLVDKTSGTRRMLEWYYDAVKSLLKSIIRDRFLKSLALTVNKLENITDKDLVGISKISLEAPKEIDLRILASDLIMENRNRKVLAIVLKNIDKFVGEDGEEYGPYPEGCLINVPHYVAKLLEDKKAVEEIFIT